MIYSPQIIVCIINRSGDVLNIFVSLYLPLVPSFLPLLPLFFVRVLRRFTAFFDSAHSGLLGRSFLIFHSAIIDNFSSIKLSAE